ncbi:MAG: hypothetical protein ACJA2N_000609 [Salibacteraceae bacterium]|jgi:hypothetical protein
MTKFVIINGFDRCGSSAISRTLNTHKGIELIMQPFNSGFIRENMYVPFESTGDVTQGVKFFEALRNGKLENSLIRSHWHHKFSSTLVAKEGQLHIIKTTINHFSQRWMNEYFPDIEVWGIWRNPQNIVESIMRNGFYGEWYSEAIALLIPTIEKEVELRKYYYPFINLLDTEAKKTAFLVAVRSYFFFQYLPNDRIIEFEEFAKDTNYLNKFLDFQNLDNISFENASNKELNIVGKAFKDTSKFDFTESEQEFMNIVFKPLIALFESKRKKND